MRISELLPHFDVYFNPFFVNRILCLQIFKDYCWNYSAIATPKTFQLIEMRDPFDRGRARA